MRVHVSDLTGKALDWMVSEAVDVAVVRRTGGMCCETVLMDVVANVPWSPSTNWDQGGPLINTLCSRLASNGDRSGPDPETGNHYDDPHVWSACARFAGGYGQGKTALIAAMRAIVTAKLGEEVEVPEVLL